MDPIANDPEFRKFATLVRKELIPMIDSSAITLSLLPKPENYDDVKYAVELAYSILLDKPIILLVSPGQRVPEHLVRVADRIVEVDRDNPAAAKDRLLSAAREIGALSPPDQD